MWVGSGSEWRREEGWIWSKDVVCMKILVYDSIHPAPCSLWTPCLLSLSWRHANYEHGNLSSILRSRVKKQVVVVVTAYNPSAGGRGWRQEDLWISMASQCSWIRELQVKVRDPASKNKMESFWGTMPEVDLWSPYTKCDICACAPIHLHTYTPMQTPTLSNKWTSSLSLSQEGRLS